MLTYFAAFFFAISINAKFITTDAIGNFYLVDQENTVIKYDSLGAELYRYSNKTNGTVTSVDAFNALKPLVYNSSSHTIVILDNTLSPLSQVQLRDKMLLQVAAVCRSSDNNIWLVDVQDYKLKKLDENGNILMESPDMVQALGYAPEVNYMIQEDQKIYISDTTKGIIIFDEYGNYEKTIPILNVKSFQLVRKNIVYSLNGAIHSFDLITLEEKVYGVENAKPFDSFIISGNRMVGLSKNEVNLYRLK